MIYYANIKDHRKAGGGEQDLFYSPNANNKNQKVPVIESRVTVRLKVDLGISPCARM